MSQKKTPRSDVARLLEEKFFGIPWASDGETDKHMRESGVSPEAYYAALKLGAQHFTTRLHGSIQHAFERLRSDEERELFLSLVLSGIDDYFGIDIAFKAEYWPRPFGDLVHTIRPGVELHGVYCTALISAENYTSGERYGWLRARLAIQFGAGAEERAKALRDAGQQALVPYGASIASAADAWKFVGMLTQASNPIAYWNEETPATRPPRPGLRLVPRPPSAPISPESDDED